MRERDDTESESYRVEQGKKPVPDPRDRLADVPLAPGAGVVGAPPPAEGTTTAAEQQAAVDRHREEARDDSREVF